MKPIRAALIFCVLFAVTGTAAARQFMQADSCTIPADETIVGTLFVFCQELTIDGTIDGNLIGAATNTTIRGEVADSVYLIGSTLDVFGTLGGDLHYMGVIAAVHDGAAFDNGGADLFTLTMSTDTNADTRIPGSVLALGYQMRLHGSVGGEVNFWGSALELAGTVGGDVNANVGDATDIDGTAQLETLFIPLPVEVDLVNPGLRIGQNAVVRGDLSYTAPTEAVISGVIDGDTTYNPIVNQFEPPTDEESLRQSLLQYLASSLREFATLSVVGVLGLLFAPQLTQAPISNLRRRPLTSLGVGTLSFIISVPVFAIALVVSLFIIFILTLIQAGTLILAGVVVLLILNVGGASLFYFVAIFVARSIFCLAIGRRLIRPLIHDDGSTRFLYIALIAGAVLIAALVSLPVIGWIFNALTLFLGLGAIINLLQAELRNLRETTGYGAATADTPPNGARFGNRYISVERPSLPGEQAASSSPNPEPQPKPRPRHTVGLDNLPPDFVWWDEL